MVITRGLNCTFLGKVPFFPALVACRCPLPTFSRVILPALPAGRVSCIILLRGWLATIPVRLTVPLPLVVLILPLWLTNLLASILITVLAVLLPLILVHTVPHFLKLVQSMLSSIGTLYTISSCCRRI